MAYKKSAPPHEFTDKGERRWLSRERAEHIVRRTVTELIEHPELASSPSAWFRSELDRFRRECKEGNPWAAVSALVHLQVMGAVPEWVVHAVVTSFDRYTARAGEVPRALGRSASWNGSSSERPFNTFSRSTRTTR